jgi:7-cyano-7-deazaguanine synthase
MYTDDAAVVLLSGGQDSTTCLHWALREFRAVHALTIEYGQRHWVEIKAARKVAGDARVASHVITALGGKGIGLGVGRASALVDKTRAIEPGADGLPSTFVPGRNYLFLGIAAAHAYELRAPHLVIGCSAVDYSGYPDCRPQALGAMRTALRLALDWPVLEVHAPLIDRSKAQTVRLARELGADCWAALGATWTCYDPTLIGDVRPCAVCPACVLRAKGFAEAGEEDPRASLP